MSHIVSVLKVMGSKKSFPSKTHKNSTHRAPMAGKAGKFGPCLDFGFQYALIRNNRSKKIGVEYWTLPGSNLPWRP